jgi:hypothetical protein
VSLAGSGAGVMDGLAFREKRCLELSVTAVWMSAKVALRDWRRRHWSYEYVSQEALKRVHFVNTEGGLAV